MCDSAANSNILTPGDPAISSAPPLILLQSEEEPGEPGKSAADSEPAVEGTQDKGAVVSAGQAGIAAASDNPPSAASLLPSTSTWTGESASESAAASALPDPWNLDQDDKNLFSGFSEEHLSKLDDVLSSEEVVNFLQQTNLNELSAGLEGPSVGATPSSSNTSNIAGAALRLSESGQLSEDSLKLDLFDSLPSGSGLPLSQTLTQNIMQLDSMSQDSLREYESVIMNAAVSDHAYAMPSTALTTPVSFTPPSTTSTFTPPSSTDTTFSPRKSARIKQRMDDGKSAFDSDSDFEYYLVPRRQVKKDQSDVSDAEKATSSPASGSPAPSTSTGAATKQKQPKRRSTRIVDLENREKAEKILQENRQKEQEAMAALQKQKEEEEAKTEEGTAASSKEADSPPPAKRGKKQVKKGALLKGKKRKLKQEESTQEEDTEEGGTPKAQPNKPAGKGKMAKKKKAEEEEQEEEEGESSPKKKKMESETESGKLVKKKKIVKKSLDAKKGTLEKAKGLLQKRKIALKRGKMAVKVAKKAASEESSDEDDIPLQAIAKLTKNEGGKASKTIAEKPKKDQKPKTGVPQPKTATQTGDEGAKETKTKVPVKEEHKNDGGDRKKMAEASLKKDPKKRSMSESSEGKTSSKPKDKKTEIHKTGAQQLASKGSADSHSKVTDKSADKGAGSVAKAEEAATPAKPIKHKHRKSEEVIIDPTVTDLFKPDGVIPSEHMKKDADAVETVGKEGKDATIPAGAKKNTHGTPVHKSTDTSSQRPSVDSKHVSGTPHGRSSSVESKTPSGTTPHVRSLSLENKTPASSSSNGRSLSIESGRAGTSVVLEKGEDKNSSSAKSTSGDGPKSGGDAGPDRKGSVLTKHSGTTPAASHGDHKGTADKKPATSSATSEGKETSHDSSVKIKSEKDHGREGHSHHKEPRRHSHEKGHTPSHHHHHHHHHQKEEKKSKEHHKHSHHTTKKEGSQPKEERKSLFEVLTKSEGTVKDQTTSESTIKKERKGSTEKHSKAHKERRRTKDDGHESGGDLSYEDDENDSDWEPANDNSTPYCICRKPHGNRFMICCDKCTEWFHGQCVGITKQLGQQMEAENREWVCPTCSGRPVEVKVTVKQETDKVSSSSKNIKQEKGATEGRKKSRSSVDSPKVLKKQGGGKEKWRTQKCVVGDCKRTARLGSVYCSNGCIIQHARLALRQLRLEREKATGQKVTDMRPSEKSHVTVVEYRSGRVLSGSNAPTEAQLELWLETHPTFEVLLSSGSSPATFYGKKKDRRSSSQSSTKKGEDRPETSTPAKKGGGEKHEGSTTIKKEEKKEEDSSSSKPPGTEEGPDPVRLNVRKSLRDALSLRAQEADDIVLSSNEIKRMALRIEEELFILFCGTGNKYRAKFRSLVFNIKDQKNKGLFRKILTRKIRASHLVKMSTEELASKELSKWRKMENKHTLEMIEQMEKEALKEGQQHIRKKTHKGEVEVEEEDMSTLVTRMEEPKSTVESKTEEEASTVIADTTDQHRAHLFDLNCKICTGKMLPPASEEPVPKKMKVAHQVVEESKSKPKKSGHSRKKEVTINDRKEVKIMERKVEDTVGEEATTPSDMPQTLAMSPDTVSTPGSSATSPGPSLSSQSPASTSQGPTLPPTGPALTSKVTVRSPDSVLQSGLDPKHKYTPSGPMVWKGFLSMQDFAKFFTSAYRVSGPAEKLGLPDTLQICGRIGPEQMWDYLGKIRQAGSRDICILRFIPGSEDEKSAYVHLYSYLSGRSRCGVVGNPPKYVKDLYIVPLASHSNIPHVLLPFEGPGLEGNRPHMLIGIVVRQKLKRPKESSESSTPGKSPHSTDKSAGLSSAKKVKPSKEEVTEAYSPTADGDESAGAAAPYIPTPTASIARVASSTPSSSSSTPSSISSHNQAKDLSSHRSSTLSAAQEVPLVEDAEPYSPSKPVIEDDEDAPYDPEDLPGLEDKSGNAAAAAMKPDMVASTSATAAVVVSASTTAEEAKTAVTITSSKAVVTTPAVKVDVSSSSVTTPQVSSAPSVSIDTVMDQISASSDPEKISSLMIKVLAGAKDPTEQQHLMATLTSKVGQQKKLQADKPPSADADPPKADSSLPSTSLWTGQAPSALPSTTTTSDVTVSSVSSTTKDSMNVSSTTPLPVSAAVKIISSILPGLQTTASATTAKTTPNISSTLFSSSPAVASTSKVSGGPEMSSVGDSKPAESTSRISSLTPNIDNMPLALKALMEDLKGNTQMVKAVDKRTERDRREREKKEASAKEASETEKKESTKDAPPPKETDSIIPGLGGGKESDTAIPGLGGAKDESSEQNTGVETSAPADDKDKAEEVSSSTDTHTDRLSPLPTKPDVLQGDVDLRIQGELDARMLSGVHVHDQDDRFPSHLPPPDSMPPPPHSLGFPPPPPTSSYMLPAHPPPVLPPHHALDVPDIDHRRHGPPPPMYPPRVGVVPPAPYRPPAQPPPPGTEVVGEEDVDMRHPPKRPVPPHRGEPPFDKRPRAEAPGPARLVPPLPPLPPQPPPPLPPLPSSSGSVDGSGPAGMEHRDRGDHGHRPPSHEPWPRGHEEGHDFDHRRHHHHDHHHGYSHRGPHHSHHHSHSPSPPSRYRSERRDRDERHRRDRHFHRR